MKILQSRFRTYTTYRDVYSNNPKYHILDDECFEENINPFMAKGICGTWFETRQKHNPFETNDINEVTCQRCIKKIQSITRELTGVLDVEDILCVLMLFVTDVLRLGDD